MANLVGLLTTFLALVVSIRACILPPTGCKYAVCEGLKAVLVPSNSANYSAVSTWSSYPYLAFVRSSFNKNIADIGPGSYTPDSWLAMKTKGWGKITSGPPTLPSVNYEYYSMKTSTTRVATSSVGGFVPTASLSSCCHACRLTKDCPQYFYVPKALPGAKDTLGGTCTFVLRGVVAKDGPFDWTNESDPKSPRTVNIMSPDVLNRTDSATKLKDSTKFPDFVAGFLGGYCNNHNYTNGTVTDDPHFVGAHGTRFDFNGELDKAFCLLTDRRIHLNGLLKGYKSDNTFGATAGADGKATRSWIKEVGLMWMDTAEKMHSLHLVAREGKFQARGNGFLASAALDGKAIDIPQAAGSSFTSGDLTFTFLGTSKKGWYDLDQFQVAIAGQLEMSIHMRVAHPKLQLPDNAEVHFNLMFSDVSVSDRVHGVLGQTYRDTPQQLTKALMYSALAQLLRSPVTADGPSGVGFLEGSVTDYVSSHVLKPDCKVSSFNV